MIPLSLEWGLLSFDLIQVIIALIAIILALRWGKTEFVGGLVFLFLYTLLEAVDITLFTTFQVIFIDVAQFGFILLSIVFFIIGMNPSWTHPGGPGRRSLQVDKKIKKNASIIADLRKL
jgi:hypothetical protein